MQNAEPIPGQGVQQRDKPKGPDLGKLMGLPKQGQPSGENPKPPSQDALAAQKELSDKIMAVAQADARDEAAKQQKQAPPQPVAQPAKPEGPDQTGDRIWLYPETVDITPQADTRHALYRAMMNTNRQWLQDGEVRRMSIGRAAAIPLIGGIVGGVLKHFGGPKDTPVGATPQLSELTGNVLQNTTLGGIIAGVLSPIASGVRRLTGENAFSQFARFANRREDRGILSRLVHGAESRALKWLFLREDRDTTQLLRILDQGTDVNRINIGSRARLNDLMAAGVMAEMKAQMVAEHNIQLSSKEQDRIKRWHDAFRLSQRIFDAKIPTAGQREIYI